MSNHPMVRVYFGEALSAYGFGEGHPFGPDRIYAFWKETVKQGLDKKVDIALPRNCTKENLSQFHTPEYIERVIEQSKTGSGFLDYGDTPAFKGVFEAASCVVGSDLDGLDETIHGEHRRVFIPIAGLHHARRIGFVVLVVQTQTRIVRV